MTLHRAYAFIGGLVAAAVLSAPAQAGDSPPSTGGFALRLDEAAPPAGENGEEAPSPGLGALKIDTLGSVEPLVLDLPDLEPAQDGDDDFYGPEARDWEVTLSGSGTNDEDFDSGTASVNGSLGWYLTDNLELGLRQSIFFADTGESSWAGNTRAFVDFHFNLDHFRPFIGANFGRLYGDDFNDTWAAAPELGIKVDVKEEAFIFGMVEYQFFFDDTDDVDDAFEEGAFVYTLGIGLIF